MESSGMIWWAGWWCGAKGCKARYVCASCASMHLLTLSPANAQSQDFLGSKLPKRLTAETRHRLHTCTLARSSS